MPQLNRGERGTRRSDLDCVGDETGPGIPLLTQDLSVRMGLELCGPQAVRSRN